MYIGFGSIADPNPARLLRTVLEAIQRVKVRAIVASGWGGLQTNDRPDNVLLIESAHTLGYSRGSPQPCITEARARWQPVYGQGSQPW